MLQARSLSVEVGGRLTLADASFSLRAGDKVGLVGRNGVGKTSLLKVLAGEADAAGGVVLRPDATGYLPQDPRPRGCGRRRHRAGPRPVRPGPRRRRASKLEALRVRVDGDPTDRNVARFARAEESFRVAGGYAAESEARRLAHGLGLPRDRLDLPLTALSGGERRRVELARILFAGSELLLLDEPTNHLDTDAKQWLLGFLRSYRGALLVVSHDLDLLDEAITRVLHLDHAELTEYKGTYSQYRTARAADEERAPARRRPAEGRDQPAHTARGLDAGPDRQTRRAPRRRSTRASHACAATRVDGPARELRIAVRFPEPPRPGAVVLNVDELTKGYGGPPVFEDVTFDVGRGERLLVMGLNGAGKTTLMRLLAGLTEADAGTVRAGHGASDRVLRTGARGDRRRARRSDPSARAERPSPTRRCATCSARSDCAARSRSRTRARCQEARRRSSRSRSSSRAGTTPSCSTSRPTTSTHRRATRSATRCAAGPARSCSSATTPSSSRASTPDRVLLMPEGDVDYWSDDLLDLVALA